MSSQSRRSYFANGLALFSMFFGAGNVIFPLIIGQSLSSNIPFALLGLFFTAIIIPFSGVISTALFQGDYYAFFQRTGNVTGYLIIVILFALIGPFGGIPRLIGLSFSSVKIYFPQLNLIIFSLISCLILFTFTYKKQRIIDILGYVLTPILLLSLSFIIVKGVLYKSSENSGQHLGAFQAFVYGLKEGYNTMDLLASFFFSSFIYRKVQASAYFSKNNNKHIFFSLFKSSIIGAFFLSLVYIGFTYLGVMHSQTLSTVSSDKLLGQIGNIVLGPYAGLVVCMVIVLACLTTAIALTVLFTDFVRDQFKSKKPPYWLCLSIVLSIAFVISTLEFMGIMSLIAPILEVVYPALLVLCLMNILYKLFDIKLVKGPFYITLFIVLISSIFSLLK